MIRYGFTLECKIDSIFPKPKNCILKQEKHTTIPMDAEKALHESEHPVMIKRKGKKAALSLEGSFSIS